METFTLILALVELVIIIVLIIVALKQRQALSKHVDKLMKTLESLKENLEQKIAEVRDEKNT